MRFSDVLQDLEKMIGMPLQSIQKGSDIVLDKIDAKNGTLRLVTSKGIGKSRPLRELEVIWTALCSNEPVHVDTVLRGSGSSRNQPETILANLPYIEWLRVQGKKHLFLYEENTHSAGALKQMDSLTAESLKLQLKKDRDKKTKEALSQIVVVSGDLRAHASLLEHCSGTPGIAIQQGAYEFFTKQQRILLVSKEVAPKCLPIGTYPVIAQKYPDKNIKEFSLFGDTYFLYQNAGIALLFF